MSSLTGLLRPLPEPTHVVWIGASLTRYEFELYPIGTTFNPKAGVYIFCKPWTGQNWLSLYVGETENFLRRLTTDRHLHHCLPDLRRAGATHICACVVSGGLTIRESIETDLRHGLKPPFNKQ